MGSVLSFFSSLMGSVLSSFCSSSLVSIPSAPPSSPPSSPTSSQIKSEVFLSFRGEDTRDNFTSHLHKALVDKQIVTFIDNKLKKGDEISPSLLKAIEESQIAIIIFSQGYASSRWCLEELVKIFECRKNHGKIVIPIFYKIVPSQVRKQTGSFKVAFAKHQSLKENSSQVQKWKDALNQAGNISGFDSHVIKQESVLIEEVVQNVLEILRKQNNVAPGAHQKLVGIESMIKDIELCIGTGDQIHNDVRCLGIWGIGGIGKTTLANAIYEKISSQFERSLFVKSVREALDKKELKCLREELYLEILGDKNAYKNQFTKKRISQMKLLIILDDVTSFKQVNDLIGDRDCFGSGSRIIIISRDRQVFKIYGVDYIYEVKELSFDNALSLFCQHAFKQNCPGVGYMELSKGVVKKVGGVPLALEVLGSSLLDQGKKYWESSMKKLETFLDNPIYGVLKVSYDGLDPYQQNLFLDIACFYRGWDDNLVKAIMDASGFSTEKDLTDLVNKSLITRSHNQIMMHDLLQAMGKRFVRESSNNASERTRLCNHDDIYDALTQAMGTEKIEGIFLDMSNSRDIHLHPDANLHNLRFLRFSNCWRGTNKVHVLQDLKSSLTKLRYFEWIGCPLKSLQSISHSENLVILKAPYSNVKQLWSGVQQFDHLKEIDLNHSKKLIRLPDLRAPNLEVLKLEECASLIEIPQFPKSLKYVHLSDCSKLRRLPEFPNNLEKLSLCWCSSLIEIPSSLQHLTRLDSLTLWGCRSLTSIPDCTGLISLQYLSIYACSKLKTLLGIPSYLENLMLDCCSKLQRLPELPNNFELISLGGCSSLIKIPSSIQHMSRLSYLDLSNCESLISIPDCTSLISLEYLILSGCSKLERLPGIPNNIQELYLDGCTSLFEIPSSFKHLNKLDSLYLCGCKRVKVLPKLPWAHIVAFDCTSLRELSCPSFPYDVFARDSSQLFINCFKLDRNSLDSFIKDTQREIQAQSSSYFQVNTRNKTPLLICYPSSEIPEWFDFKSVGSFVDVKLPLDWIDYNFLCFALCAVVSFPDQCKSESSINVRCECNVKSKEGGHNWDRMCDNLLISVDCAMPHIRSSHVIIGSGFHFLRERHDNEFTFHFYGQKQVSWNKTCKVEKCGVHLIFGKHLEKSDQNEEVDELHREESKEDDQLHLEEFNGEDEPHLKTLEHI